jgi:hypothetical protein
MAYDKERPASQERKGARKAEAVAACARAIRKAKDWAASTRRDALEAARLGAPHAAAAEHIADMAEAALATLEASTV